MHKAIIEVNHVPTIVQTWGRWIEETPAKNEDIILCIPGNPGITEYYKQFLETLYNKLQCPVWIVSHAGHTRIKNKNVKFPKLKDNEQLYNVQGQIDHKIEFFRKYIPADARVFLIGHSIGSYICLNLMKNEDIQRQVVKTYCLFPTIEDMAETPNGKFLTGIIYYIVGLILFLSWIFSILPECVQIFLLNTYFVIHSLSRDNSPPTNDLIHPAVLNKVFFMAYEEMDVVRTLDSNLIEQNLNKIKLYYGATDNWAPVSYYRKITEKFPNLDAELCTRKFDHAFVLKNQVEVANMVAGWIESDK